MTKTYKNHFYLGQTWLGSGRLFVEKLDQISIKKQHHTALVLNGQDQHNMKKQLLSWADKVEVWKAFCQKVGPNQHPEATKYSTSVQPTRSYSISV